MSKESKKLIDLLNRAHKKESKGSDTLAEVVRVEGDTAWVHYPGGVDETPVRLTMNAAPGDIVQVRVSGSRAWLTGNKSAPPTDDAKANQARAVADSAHQKALDSEQETIRAKEHADSAGRAADRAWQKAGEAETAAGEARQSAVTANKAANGALSQLSIVEDVVGTLSWISEHGTYALSQDTEVIPGKHYFTRTGTGTPESPYSYNIVVNPSGDPSSEGYFELTDIDEAVSNYVSSHLALTNAGLWVVNDNDSYKILLASDGMKVYDAEGNLVATFGESIDFSSSRPQYIGGEEAYIIFYDSDHDGVPDAINIGGSKVTLGGTKHLSDLLTDLDISTRQTASGAEITVGSHTVSLNNGEDAVLLRIDSSRGNVFKNNQVSTVLTVNVIKAGETITNITRLRQVFGAGAYIQWYWKKVNEDAFHVIVSTDSMISDSGFTLTLTPDKVDTKVTFQCELIS